MDKTVRVILNMEGEHLDLPADSYALLDAADRIAAPNGLLFTVLDMPPGVKYERVCQGGLAELNLLAEMLIIMNRQQRDAFHGLAAMPGYNGDDLPGAADLINLARNVDKCQVLYEVHSYAELGRFFVDNGLFPLPVSSYLPEKMYEYLDYAKIGQEVQEREGGVFLKDCYVLPMEPLELLYDGKHPPQLESASAPFLISFSLGPDTESIVSLELPASSQEVAAALDKIDSCCPEECVCRQLDGVLPQARDWLHDMGDFDTLNQLAVQVKELSSRGELTKYKAMLQATDCQDFETALLLSTQTQNYTLEVDVHDAEGFAIADLHCLLDEGSAEELIPFVDLQDYGEAIMERYRSELTAYGLLSRIDEQPIQAPQEEPQENMDQQML